MRSSLFVAILAICFLAACRQGGETPQPTCKPTVLNIPGPQYDFFYHHRRDRVQARVGWDTSGRPVTMDCILDGRPDRSYKFEYDGDDNLVKVAVQDAQDTTAPSLSFRWPAGTKHSLAPQCQVNLGDDPELTYEFNPSHQLTAIRQEGKLLEHIFYDPRGNMTVDSLFDLNGTARSYLRYDAYDDKPNPGLTHRTLQLFLQMYSRNNPTNMSRYLIAIGISATGEARTYDGKAEYTYNDEGLPLTMNGNEYGVYDCPKK